MQSENSTQQNKTATSSPLKVKEDNVTNVSVRMENVPEGREATVINTASTEIQQDKVSSPARVEDCIDTNTHTYTQVISQTAASTIAAVETVAQSNMLHTLGHCSALQRSFPHIVPHSSFPNSHSGTFPLSSTYEVPVPMPRSNLTSIQRSSAPIDLVTSSTSFLTRVVESSPHSAQSYVPTHTSFTHDLHSSMGQSSNEKRGQKRKLQYEGSSDQESDITRHESTVRSQDEAMSSESRASAHTHREAGRYESWTSKQLRKKCSHLKLRGLKNVKKHVMVDALYRYYRNLRHQEGTCDIQSDGVGYTENDISLYANPSVNYVPQQSLKESVPPRSYYDTCRNVLIEKESEQRDVPHGVERDASVTEEKTLNIVVTSKDIIRLVDIVLSSEFVDRLVSELSRWQFWVDVHVRYNIMLQREVEMEGKFSHANVSQSHLTGMRASITSNSYSSMHLWAMWKELTKAYSRACFAFTAAGASEGEYIQFCEGRPDVYYFHQCLHARPDLLHLIKSHEYLEEKPNNHVTENKSRTNTVLPRVGSRTEYSHSSDIQMVHSRSRPNVEHTEKAPSARISRRNGDSKPSEVNTGNTQGLSDIQQMETTGESSNGSNTSISSLGARGTDLPTRYRSKREESVSEQKYCALLMQNFESVFESVHNKSILLAALGKDPNSSDRMIADLKEDIHVLSTLKRSYRNKLRNMMD